ncbi:4826_t:CDS:2 [Acaulospora colombiana]|uniref:4826_t:CDS:1 n=1 Tax=Acaulospora colombiana TaxID=27376 RepID=A0ACA9KW21_9GLOM|nr:4826_t:CDS:2 [Acaulospora colombiana]
MFHSPRQRVPQASVNVTPRLTLSAAVVEGVLFIIKRKPVHSAGTLPRRPEAVSAFLHIDDKITGVKKNGFREGTQAKRKKIVAADVE